MSMIAPIETLIGIPREMHEVEWSWCRSFFNREGFEFFLADLATRAPQQWAALSLDRVVGAPSAPTEYQRIG
jgi:hypothetical protein